MCAQLCLLWWVPDLITMNAFTAVPPNIVDGESSGDVKVEEGANITLECSATGTPPPTITWRRETRANININATTHGTYKESRIRLGMELLVGVANDNFTII